VKFFSDSTELVLLLLMNVCDARMFFSVSVLLSYIAFR
jgi:hypothetical protein